MKHSIVLQTPPISLLPPNPSTALDVLLSYCLIGCAKCRSKYPALKKHWPLASTIKPIMEQEGWAVSRSPLPSRLNDQNKQWVSVFSRDGGVCVCVCPPHTPPISTLVIIGTQRLVGKWMVRGGGGFTLKIYCTRFTVVWAWVYLFIFTRRQWTIILFKKLFFHDTPKSFIKRNKCARMRTHTSKIKTGSNNLTIIFLIELFNFISGDHNLVVASQANPGQNIGQSIWINSYRKKESQKFSQKHRLVKV